MADSVDRAAIWQRLQALTESQKSLVHNWVEHKSPDSEETYYYNSETKESVWEKPVELQTAGEIVLSESTWKEYKDPEGKIYFHNIETGNRSINQSFDRWIVFWSIWNTDCFLFLFEVDQANSVVEKYKIIVELNFWEKFRIDWITELSVDCSIFLTVINQSINQSINHRRRFHFDWLRAMT